VGSGCAEGAIAGNVRKFVLCVFVAAHRAASVCLGTSGEMSSTAEKANGVGVGVGVGVTMSSVNDSEERE
jgi:hypothetical protein